VTTAGGKDKAMEAVAVERQRWLDLTGSGYTISMKNLKAYLEGRDLPHSL
jgi:hypothetical protein